MMFDLVVIGGGPAGYPAAIRAAHLGMKTALVEKLPVFGGTCLNWGCVPTKHYFEVAHLLHKLHQGKRLGLDAQISGFSLAPVNQKKSALVAQVVKGVAHLLKKAGVTTIQGSASFQDAHTLAVTQAGKQSTVQGRRFLIATGSEPAIPPVMRIDHPGLLTSREILDLDSLPGELIVVGAGAIGLEFATIFHLFGARVTVVELLERLAPLEDVDVSRALEKAFKRQRIACYTNTRVHAVGADGDRLQVRAESGQKGALSLEADAVLVATGRRANTGHLGLETVGIGLENGCIPVSPMGQTTQAHIYAAGDVLNTPQLAHVATAEGLLAVAHMAGRPARPVPYHAVPSFICSLPEIGSTGLTEQDARARGLDVRTVTLPLKAVAKSQIKLDAGGFVKLVLQNERLLGCHIIGPDAAELLCEPTLAITTGMGPADISRAIHAHPTLGESLLEACHLAEGLPIHVPKTG